MENCIIFRAIYFLLRPKITQKSTTPLVKKVIKVRKTKLNETSSVPVQVDLPKKTPQPRKKIEIF